MATLGTLMFFCGKMGAGKSFEAAKIAQKSKAVLIVEDEWLAALYPDKIASIRDYAHYSDLLKPPVMRLTQSLLVAGVDVVMDFPANTISQRQWLKAISDEVGAHHLMYFIDLSDEACLERVKNRALESPDRQRTDTEEIFFAMLEYFSRPSPDEQINTIIIDNGG